MSWMTCCVAIGLAGTMAVHAEVSVEGSTVYVIVLGVIEGPDPIPQVLWEPVREDVDPSLMLNPDGAIRGDGRPDVAYHPSTGWPLVVWAYNNGGDHDIAFSEWRGTAWSEPRFLTSTSSDERHPRLCLAQDGTVHVVWWVAGMNKIVRVKRNPGSSTWSAEEPVATGGTVRRPTVAVWGGTVLVAYERENAGGTGQEVVLAERQTGGAYVHEVVTTTSRFEALDIVLHVEATRLWMDWKQSDGQFAWSRLAGETWSPPATLPWDDTAWVGEDAARQQARSAALSAD